MHPEKIYLWQYFVDTPEEQITSQWFDKRASDLNITNIEYIRADTVIDPDKVELLVEALTDIAWRKGVWPSQAEKVIVKIAEEALEQYHKEN